MHKRPSTGCDTLEVPHQFWDGPGTHGHDRSTTAFSFCTVPCKLCNRPASSYLIILRSGVCDRATLRVEMSGCFLRRCRWHTRPRMEYVGKAKIN